jgi:hypothetical protein
MKATPEQVEASRAAGPEGLIVIDTRTGHVIPTGDPVFDGTTMIPEYEARQRGLSAIAWVDESGTLVYT